MKLVVVVLFAMARIGSLTAITSDAVLFDGLPSFVAPVMPGTVVLPSAVGVPVTVQTMLAPAATVAGVDGEQLAVRPAGRAPTEHVAAVALSVADAEFVHEYEPV
jgi:hypothetical protein